MSLQAGTNPAVLFCRIYAQPDKKSERIKNDLY